MFSLLKASCALMRVIISWRWENIHMAQNTPGTQHFKRWNHLAGSQLDYFNQKQCPHTSIWIYPGKFVDFLSTFSLPYDSISVLYCTGFQSKKQDEDC